MRRTALAGQAADTEGKGRLASSTRAGHRGGANRIAARLRWPASLVALALAAACGDGPVAVTPGTTANTVARVEVSPGTHLLQAGEVYRFTAKPLAADGSLVSQAVEWQSSDAQVAEVDGSGMVTARAGGSVVISARSGGRTGQATLTVQATPLPAAVAQVAIFPGSPMSVGIGGTLQLGTTVSAADGTVLTGRAVEWAVSDTLVARISQAGLVEGRAEGTAVVTARVEGKSAYASVAVVFSRSPNEPVALVHVEAPRGRIDPGETMQLTATVRAADGRALEREVQWSSEAPGVASVDAAGRVTGHRTGWTRITATVDGKPGSVVVQVAAWTTQALLRMDDAALPGTFSIQATATLGAYDFRVSEGVLRTLEGPGQGTFEIALNGWFMPKSGVGTQTAYTVQGSYQHDLLTGERTFYPTGGAPFTSVKQADGTLLVTVRFPGSAAATRLLFAGQ